MDGQDDNRQPWLAEGRSGVRITIAGGGTGGHLFPGIAIAEEFLARDGKNQVLFVGTDRGIEKTVLPRLGLPLRTIPVEGIKGRGLAKTLKALVKIPWGLAASRKMVCEFGPDLVLGVGGYASGPAVLAAQLMGVPTAIAEQNAFPGLTNRLLGRIADRIFLAFAPPRQWFPTERIRVTGNPIRAAFLTKGTRDPDTEGLFTVLVFGGSQGAHAINRIAGEALADLRPFRDRLRFIHQTGEKDREAVAETYRAQGFTAEVSAFILDMEQAYRRADLLVCRAGATSIAEITAAGKAAVLIPFPFAVNDHQTQNARVLAEAGGAEMIAERDLTGPRLAALIQRLRDDPGALRKMEAAAAALGHPRAAKEIVDECLTLIRVRRAGKRWRMR